jgi:hypothetical protein
MGVFFLIIQILGAIPVIIRLIKEIAGLINRLPADQRRQVTEEIAELARQARARQDTGHIAARLEEIARRFRK